MKHSRCRDHRRRLHGRERRVSPRHSAASPMSSLIEREPQLGTGVNRTECRRLSPPVLAPGQHRALEGIDRALRQLRGGGRPPDRLLAGRVSLFALAPSTAWPHSGGTSRCNARTASTSTGSRRTTRARLCARLSSRPASSRATFCADDGIADPNGVTMGFARAAQARGVEIRRGEEVTGSRQSKRPASRRCRRAQGPIATRIVVNAGGPVGARNRPDGRRRRAGRRPSGATSSSRRRRAAAAGTPRIAARAGSRLMVIDFESTFYFHREGGGLLFGMGDPDERPGFDTTVRWDFLPQGDRGRRAAAARARRRRGLTRVGGPL